MVQMFPQKIVSFSTNGEKYVFEKIFFNLQDDWYLFYEPIILGYTPDFILFNKHFGAIILEIKDFRHETIHSMDQHFWKINTKSGITTIKSPFKQAQNYSYKLINLLERISSLTTKSQDYMNRLKFPVLTFCVFPYLSKKDAVKINLHNFIPSHNIILKNDLFNLEIFFNKITKARELFFKPERLSTKDIQIIIDSIAPRFESEEIHIGSTDTIQFDIIELPNFVDEQIFVVDKIMHKLNRNQLVAENIFIFINDIRSSLMTAQNYKETLVKMIKTKNLIINKRDKGINLRYYKDFDLSYLLNGERYIFFMDFKFMPKTTLNHLINLFNQVDNNLYTKNTYITSSIE